jgi:exodeoxyribonuclease VIII
MKQPVGWFDDRPDDGLERLSYSSLKNFFRSPAHYRYFKDHPKPPTPQMIFGNAVHSVCFDTPDDVVIAPDINKRTKDGRAEWAAFEEDNKDKYIVTEDESETIRNIVDAVYNHRIARRVLQSPSVEFEKWGLFDDLLTGVPCVMRVDILDRKRKVIADLKTTVNADQDEFTKQLFRFGYHYQGGFYKYGYHRIDEHLDTTFLLIAVETTPPYGVNVFPVRGKALSVAWDTITRHLEPFARCLRKNEWPNYRQILRDIDTPGWIK